MKILLIFVLMILTVTTSWGDDSDISAWGVSHVPQILKDPKTGVVFYLESDRRHVSAIAPDGNLLWCSELVPPFDKNRQGSRDMGIHEIRFAEPNDHGGGPGSGEDYLRVNIFGEGYGGKSDYINKKTGKPGSHCEVS